MGDRTEPKPYEMRTSTGRLALELGTGEWTRVGARGGLGRPRR